ncbi:hypothetical protein EKO04_000078 [Ascochyta lentis]|uniref:Uncharacterized protein n=1 Tax=Ascochyta lentis TaxID=205686 RepID=A0A8H7JEZ2_9PLEO|nr:hypothetical protein EKO04_000078 [Ascochyta lentis]
MCGGYIARVDKCSGDDALAPQLALQASQDAIEGYRDKIKAGWSAAIGGFAQDWEQLLPGFGNSAREPTFADEVECGRGVAFLIVPHTGGVISTP